MKSPSDELVRLKKVLLGDALKIPNGVLEVLKIDIKSVLSSYFEVDDEVKTEVTVDENGVYDVKINAKCRSVKKVKAL